MHDGCTGASGDGLQMLQKIRMKGFSNKAMPAVAKFTCESCEAVVEMTTLEYKCPSCDMVYAVTPCSAADVSRIRPAGKNV